MSAIWLSAFNAAVLCLCLGHRVQEDGALAANWLLVGFLAAIPPSSAQSS
jgi:hypothetical protein